MSGAKVTSNTHSYDDGRYAHCGEWVEHGYGVSTSPDGAFEGLWQQGRYVSGKLTLASGNVYLGRWLDGLRSGPAVERATDGEYSGDFTLDAREPYGVLQKPDGVCTYRGKWISGEQSGEGVEVFPDGGVYRGQYKNGKRDGYGIRTSYAYENEKSPVKKKSSTLELARRNKLTGLSSGSTRQLTHGRPSLPTFMPLLMTNMSREKSGSTPVLSRSGATPKLPTDDSFSDGEVAQKYEGEWEAGKRHGYGVVEMVGHFKYYGQWDNNKRSGFGVSEYLITGQEEKGRWLNGTCVEPVKKSKLMSLLKRNQLETKVAKAHLQAIQAANMARDSAKTADINAAAADAKASTAKSEMKKAARHAHLAREVVIKSQSVAGLARSTSSLGLGSRGASEAASNSSGSGSSSIAGQGVQFSVGPDGGDEDKDTGDGKKHLSKIPVSSLSDQLEVERETCPFKHRSS